MRRGARVPRDWSAPLVLWLFAAPALAREITDPEAATSPSPVEGSEPARPAPFQAPDTTRSAVEASAPAPPAAVPPIVDPPVSAPPSALAPPVPGQPGHPAVAGTAPEHERLGVFVHADLGGGYLRTTGSRGGSSFASQGGALGIGVAVGWAPDEAWALGLELWTWKSLADSGLGPNTSLELQALGLNVTRYIVTEDVFASVVVSGTRLAITDAGDRVEYDSSDIGFGFKVLLGKEWHVTSWLGLGVAGELFVSVNRAGGETLRTLGGGLVFSCTGR